MTSTEITKIIADTFYITYLPEDEKEYQSYIDFLERYINNSQFDRLRFIHDAKKCNENEKKSNLYEHLLPIKDLCKEDEDKFEEIEKAYQEIHEHGFKGGYVRAILEVLYDKKYQENFNSMTDRYLEKVWNKKENLSFDIIIPFMNLASKEFSRKEYKSFFWKTDEVTQINAIGSTKHGTTEKVDNPYSAYKVFAQGEYSKLLIGYKAAIEKNKSIDSLKQLLEYGFSTILTDEKICTYKSKDGTPIIIIPIKENYKSDKTKSTTTKDDSIKDNPKKEIKFERNLLIIDLQTEAIQKILQHFNNYIPYDLESKREEIYYECKHIYFSHFKDTEQFDRLDKNKDGNRYTETEIQFINKYFYYLGIDSNRKLSIEEKINVLVQVIGSRKLDENPYKEKINSLADNEEWQSIVYKSNGEKASSLSILAYSPEVSLFGHSADENADALNFKGSISAFSETNDYEENEFVRSLSEEDLPEEAEQIKNQFKQNFPNTKLMPESMGRYFKKILEVPSVSQKKFGEVQKSLKHAIPEKKKEIDSYFDSLKPSENSLKADDYIPWDKLAEKFCPNAKEKIIATKVDFGFICLDKDRSWEGTWNRYYKYENLGSKESFREKMSSIYSYSDKKNKKSEPKTLKISPNKIGR